MIWSGTLSFGLLHVPVKLMPGQRSVDLQFRMLDSRVYEAKEQAQASA